MKGSLSSVSPLEIVFLTSHRENWGFSGPNDVAFLSRQTLYKSDMTLVIPLGFTSPRPNLDLSVLARAFMQPCLVEGAAELLQFPIAPWKSCSALSSPVWSCTGCMINQQWLGVPSFVLVIKSIFYTTIATQQKTNKTRQIPLCGWDSIVKGVK